MNPSQSGLGYAAEIVNALIQAHHHPNIDAVVSSRDPSTAPAASAQPLININKEVFGLACENNCHDIRLRTIRFSSGLNPSLETSIYKPIYSRILVSVSSKFPSWPLEGIWAGAYGSHGIEFVLLRYETVHQETVLNAFKITGDMNVPKGIVTWSAFMCQGGDRHLGRASSSWDVIDADYFREATGQDWAASDDSSISTDDSVTPEENEILPNIDLAKSTELQATAVYPGYGTIGLTGFRHPSRTPLDGLFLF